MFNRLCTIKKIVSTTLNWNSVLMVRIGFKKEVIAIFKNGSSIEVSRGKWDKFTGYVNFFYELPGAKIKKEVATFIYKGTPLTFYLGSKGHNVLKEIFGQDPYGIFLKKGDVREKQVVDIGGYIGDTAIYFALKGARHVYTFEPYPYLYQLAKKNISVNNLNKKCSVVNAGISGTSSYVILQPSLNESGPIKESKEGIKVPIITLENIVKKYKIKNAILKIDCEGCEYKIIKESSKSTLEMFSVIVIEYHDGFSDLEKKLKRAGFKKVMHTSPKNHKGMALGYIIARR